ncbi:MAG: hypothetical protein O2854_07620 [Chloroflexi bacterium]|nr:hypothetical protein [Chloroflexota bacterium]
MTTTGVAVLDRLSADIGDTFFENALPYFTATSDGEADGTTIVATGLKDVFRADDTATGWVRMRSGAAAGQIRAIPNTSSFTYTSGTLTVAAFIAQIVSGATFEIHRVHPAIKIGKINQAIEELYPTLYLPVRDETLIVDSWLENGGLEAGATNVFTGWTKTDTWTETALFTLSGARAALSGGTGSILYQDVTSLVNASPAPNSVIPLKEIIGRTVKVRAGCYGTVTTPTIRVSWGAGGSDFVASDAHSGELGWEFLEAETVIPTTADFVRIELRPGAANVAFDHASLIVQGVPRYRYTVPVSIIDGPTHIEMQADADKPEGPYYPVTARNRPVEGRMLRLQGRGYLSTFATDSTFDAATTEVDSQRLNMLTNKAAALMAETGQARRLFSEAAEIDWEGKANDLKRRPGVRMVPMSAQMPDEGVWHLERDSSNKYIVFERNHG